ncbi:Protein involved in sex pheromone biosynthesis [Salinibacillus kushneri]|uniref:Protein involved in sex pheromone biosynthesis n=1 Tax=Salinibacillus kushneri TaxID=237682 RepID=A0A1I0J7R0_9BACI|nr:CamS family sex pheromone protein [Salinibacillus kushneri]SEU05859.1 Protein involved in sex pheromone biosynthesis [Salinibacillus kushneri]
MKKSLLILVLFILIIAGCTPNYDEEEEIVQDTKEEESETAIVPSYNISDEEYKMPVEYKPAAARGVIVNQVFNRFDITELEEGLRRHSKDAFDPEDYLFQEGQYLTEDMVYSWLERKNEDDKGLNPALKGDKNDPKSYRDAPRYLSHVLEQNYLQKTEGNQVEVRGVSIGLALKSVYQFEAKTGGPTYYEDISQKEMLAKGKEYAQTILKRIRNIEELQDVPVMIALFREEEQSSLVPGNFVAKTFVEGGSSSTGEWETINEDYILFPSDEAEDKHQTEAAVMSDFTSEVREFFPNFVGVVGKGFYVNDELQEIKIKIPIEFHGKTEVTAFSQFAYGLIMETFTNNYGIEVNIQSPDKQEALIWRDAGEEEPEVYIYQ